MPALTTKDFVAAVLFVAVALGIALIGGGWFALGRVDPLLAVPGLGWAALAMLAWHRAASPRRLGAIALGAVMPLLLLAVVKSPSAFDPIQAGLLCLSASGLGWIFGYVRARLRMARGGPLLRLVAGVAAAVVIANAAPPFLAPLYAVSERADGPRLILVSALPLHPVSGDIATAVRGGGRPEPALAWLDAHYRVDRRDPAMLDPMPQDSLLLLAHPPAMPPQTLVLVDNWVRAGGRAIVLADGLSSWPAPFSVGDTRNPPVTSLLTPLLDHWGLALDAPPGLVEAPLSISDGDQRLDLFSSGRFRATTPATAQCLLRSDGRIAECAVGRGRVLIVADADWLDAVHWQGPQGARGAIGWRAGNMLWLGAQLDRLAGQRGDGPHGVVTPMWAQW